MTHTPTRTEFSDLKVKVGQYFWQVDNDNVPPPFHDGEWETELAKQLVDLAEAHETSELLCATSSGPSLDFGHHGFSVWVALVGSPPMIKACGNLIQEIIPQKCLQRGLVHPEQDWVARIRMADGKVWIPDDGYSWRALSPEQDEEMQPSEFDDAVEDEMPGHDREYVSIKPTAKAKRKSNAARGDVEVGYYQQKIERMLKLPQGSVKFVKPDGSIVKRNLLVRTLREKWDS